jgi:hypothetical protein
VTAEGISLNPMAEQKSLPSCWVRRSKLQFGSSLLMRFLEPVHVPLCESLLPSLHPACWRRISELINRSLLLEILLSHRVQLSVGRQLCVARRLLSRLHPDFVSGPFFSGSPVRPTMSQKRRDATHDEGRQSHQHKKPHRLKLHSLE